MALWPHFGGSDTGDQQVAHANQNTHTQALPPLSWRKGLVQAELAEVLG